MSTNAVPNTLIIQALEDMKALQITEFDVGDKTVFFDKFIICTGRSSRHVKSIADAVAKACQTKKIKPKHLEEDEDNEWILIDLGDTVVHVMTAHIRAFYNLEDLWNGDASKQQEASSQ